MQTSTRRARAIAITEDRNTASLAVRLLLAALCAAAALGSLPGLAGL